MTSLSKIIFGAVTVVTVIVVVVVVAHAFTGPGNLTPGSGNGALIYENGYAGFGATSSAYYLSVSSSTDSLFGLLRSGASNPVIFKEGTDSAFIINQGASDVLTIKAGNVGIGTTGPNYKLDVSGMVQSGGIRFQGGGIGLGRDPTGAYDQIVSVGSIKLEPGSADYVIIDTGTGLRVTSGNVGIGDTNPTSTLSVAGEIKSSSGGIRFPDATLQTTAFSGASQTVSAANVSSGTFGANTSFGNYTFGTSTNPILHIDNTNARVGIGTTSPDAKLDIQLPTSGDVRVKRLSGTNAYRLATDSNQQAQFLMSNIAGTTVIQLATDSSTSGDFTYFNSGNVGIGTANPLKLLHVGAGADTPLSSPTLYVTANGGTTLTLRDSTNDIEAKIAVDTSTPRIGTETSHNFQIMTAGTSRVTFDTSGNVGIGTTGPDGKLDVRGSSGTIDITNDTAASNIAKFVGNATNRAGFFTIAGTNVPSVNSVALISSETGGGLAFAGRSGGATPAVNMVITGAGNVGIGTTGPGYKLDVQGGQINSSGGLCIAGDCKTAWSQVGGGGTPAGSTGYVQFNDAGAFGGDSNLFWDNTNKRLGIGITPSYTLQVAGTIRADNGTTLQSIVGNMNAQYISSGTFGSTTGNGNFTFPASLTVDTDTLFVDSLNHRVGIGTTGPGVKLDVSGGSIRVANAQNYLGAYGAGSVVIAQVDASGNVRLGDTGTITIPAVGANAGNVGIGTTGPSEKLEVRSAPSGGGIQGSFRSNSGTNVSYGGIFPANTAGNVMYMTVGDASFSPATYYAKALWGTIAGSGGVALRFGANARSDDMVIDTSGNVGIGTASPGAKLHIFSASAGAVAVDSSGDELAVENSGDAGISIIGGNVNSSAIFFGDADNEGVGRIRYDHTTNSMRFNTNDSEKVRIDSTGNVGIGTTGPIAPLTVSTAIDNTDLGTKGLNISTPSGVAGNIIPLTFTGLGGSNRARAGIGMVVGSDWGKGDLAFYTRNASDGSALSSSDEKMRILTGGNVGIGTAGPGQKLEVNGTAQAATFYASTGVSTFDATVAAGTVEATQMCLGNGTNCITSWPSGGSGTITGVTAGAGLTGGGTSGTVNLDIGAGTGVSVAADSISVNYGSTAGTAVQGNTAITITAGTGMSGGGAITLGAGGSVTLNNAGDTTADTIADDGVISTGETNFTNQALLTSSGPSFSIFYDNDNTGYYVNPASTSRMNKIDVDTVDPVYTIGGVKFATYMATMTGVKEETTGVIKLQETSNKRQGVYEYVIDFNKVERGSDLWLFWQVTDFGQNWDKLTALLTAGFDGKVWYEKDPQNNRLTILGSPTSLGASLEVSYRLTAPRFDHAKWPNTSDSVWEGLVIPEK